MSKEIITDNSDQPRSIDEISYQRDPKEVKQLPKFKPGNTPHTQYGNQTLNANIPWQRIVQEIQVHYTLEQLVNEAGIPPANLRKILREDYRKLSFKMGAKLLTIHARFYPEQY